MIKTFDNKDESKYIELIEGLNDGIYISDLKGVLTFSNPALARILGFEHPNSIVGKKFMEFLPAEKVDTLNHKYKTAMEYGSSSGLIITEIIKQDGTMGVIEIKPQNILEKGKPVGSRGIVRDLTMQKMNIKKLELSERKYRAIIDASPIPYALNDENQNITLLNSAFVNTFGYTMEDIPTLDEWWPKAYPDPGYRQWVATTWKSHLDKAKLNATPFEPMELIIRCKDGTNRTVLVSAASLSDMFDGEHLVILFDITARKETEDALAREQYLLRSILDNIPDAIYFKDTNSRFLRINKALANIFGLKDPSTAIGMSDHDFFTSEHAREALNDEQGIIKTGIPIIGKEEMETWADKKPTWVSTTKMPFLDEKGDIIGTFGISRDITTRKHAEELLREREARLHELNATKDKFFSIVSHDLKNPLFAIIGLSEIFLELVNEKKYVEAAKYANIIKESSGKAMDLLTNLMEWSRTQRGKIEFKFEKIELTQLVDEVVELMRFQAQQKSIAITKELPLNVNLVGDKAMIGTILRNLISNAIKFTHCGGKVVISATQNQNDYRICVSDNGVGISPKSIVKLFRIDQSFSTTGTQKEEGTGLGLILCKEFVGKHGGRIWVKSEEKKGSKFYFTIPLVDLDNPI